MNINTCTDYLLRRINPSSTLGALEVFPSYFEIETIHNCNARCRMCPTLKNNRPKECMSDSLFAKIILEIGHHTDRVQRVNLFRDGEPLLDPQLEQRVQLCKDAGITCVSITSNMSLTTPDRAERLLRSGLDMIDMSIDGFSAETFEYIRCGLKYATVLENALQFITIRNALQSSCRIRVRMVLQETNAHEWEEYAHFWRKHLGALDTVMNHPIHNWGNQLRQFSPIVESSQAQVPCVALWSLMPIFADGTVPLCNVDFDARYALGSLREHSIAELWGSGAMQKHREKHLLLQKKEISICEGCNAWDKPVYT